MDICSYYSMVQVVPLLKLIAQAIVVKKISTAPPLTTITFEEATH